MGAALGIPAGVLLTLLKRKISPPGKLQFPENEEAFPVLQTEKKSFDVGLGHVLGGIGGAAVGGYGADYVMGKQREKKLNRMMEYKKDLLNKLLLHEQAMAAGTPAKAPMPDMSGVTPKAAAEKKASDIPVSGVLKTLARDFKNLPQGLQLAMAGIAIPAGAYGVHQGFQKGVISDPNYALARKLKASLSERMGGERGAPIPIKLTGSDLSSGPIQKGTADVRNPEKGRDVLDRL
jgi:hypothetical protein